MEALLRIQKELQKRNMTSQNTVTYSCRQCSDTGWVETENNCYKKCSCVEIKHIKSCWTNYGVSPEAVKTLEDYVAYNKISNLVKEKAKKYMLDFSELRAKENNWFGIFGQTGAGKSHVAVAMGASLLTREDKPLKVIYMPYLEVMRELKTNVLEEEYYLKLLTRYQRAEVLIIDDLFKDKVKKNKIAYELTETDIKHLYPIINYRYFNKLPTIISSECKPDMLLDLDEALAGRILERCEDNITIFNGEENNYRLRKFHKN